MDRGASMHTEQSRDPSSSSAAGKMPGCPLLPPLWAVPLVAAVILPVTAAATQPFVARGDMVATCICGSWVVGAMILAGA